MYLYLLIQLPLRTNSPPLEEKNWRIWVYLMHFNFSIARFYFYSIFFCFYFFYFLAIIFSTLLFHVTDTIHICSKTKRKSWINIKMSKTDELLLLNMYENSKWKQKIFISQDQWYSFCQKTRLSLVALSDAFWKKVWLSKFNFSTTESIMVSETNVNSVFLMHYSCKLSCKILGRT